MELDALRRLGLMPSIPTHHTLITLTLATRIPMPTTQALITPMPTTPMLTTPMGTMPMEMIPSGAMLMASVLGLLPQP